MCFQDLNHFTILICKEIIEGENLHVYNIPAHANKRSTKNTKKKYTEVLNHYSQIILKKNLPNQLDFHWHFGCLLCQVVLWVFVLQLSLGSHMDTAVEHLHCTVFPDTFLFLLSFPTSCHSLFCLCQGLRHTKTQWDMPGGNKDGSKAAGLWVVKSVAKSIAYPGATWIGSENFCLILEKSHWRLSHLVSGSSQNSPMAAMDRKFMEFAFKIKNRLDLPAM